VVKDRKVFSPSRMMSHGKCARKYEYNDLPFSTPVRDKTALLFGKSVHLAIEKYNGSITQNPLKRTIRSTIEKQFQLAWDSRVSGRLRGDYHLCRDNFMAFEFWRLAEIGSSGDFKPNVCEVDTYSNKFHAIIDWFKNGRLIDFKTNKKAELDISYQVQMWTQAEVLKFAGFEVKSLELFFLRHNKLMKVPKPNFAWLYKIRQGVMDAIASNHFPPNRSILCHWCDHKLRCDYVDKKVKNYSRRKFSLWSETADSWNKAIMPQWITHELEW